MIWHRVAIAATITAVSPISAIAAGPFDGSAPILCAVTQAVECAPDGTCSNEPDPDLNAPQFLWIDVAKNTVRTTRPGGEDLNTEASKIVHGDGWLILQGDDNGRGWTANLTESTGQMSVAVSGDGVAFLLFGSCTTI